MNILFGNQKGGVGKTTLCTLTANYIAKHTEYQLSVMDFDFQLSLYNEYKRKKEVNSDSLPYKVHACTLSQSDILLKKLASLENQLIFIDSPGKLDDSYILNLVRGADILVVPFSYEKKTFESTYIYLQVVEKVNPNANIILVPNRIKSTMRYHIKEKADQALRSKGLLLDTVVPDLASLMRTNIYELDKTQSDFVQPLADVLLNNFLSKAVSPS